MRAERTTFRRCALRTSRARNTVSLSYLSANFSPLDSLGLFQGFPVSSYTASTHFAGAASMSHFRFHARYSRPAFRCAFSWSETRQFLRGVPLVVSPLATNEARYLFLASRICCLPSSVCRNRSILAALKISRRFPASVLKPYLCLAASFMQILHESLILACLPCCLPRAE